MKPTFALDLSRDVIALLHRTPKGWLTIGEVGFDAPDMAETLDHLRKTALGLSPLGLACKVILPNSQILYTEVHAPGPSREDKRRQIAQALQGRTPYAVEDLVFDWSGKGAVVRVAVVARETLEEAEAFATAYRLNPVSFVAIPEADMFHGEAWFGPSNSVDTILAPGETVERDRDAVTIIPLAAAEPAPAPVEDASLPGLSEALNAEVTEADLAALAQAPRAADKVEEFEPVEPPADLEDPLLAPPAADAAEVKAEPATSGDTPDNAPVATVAPPTAEEVAVAAPAAEAKAEPAPSATEAGKTDPDRPAPAALSAEESLAAALDVGTDEAPFTEVADEAEAAGGPGAPGPAARGPARVLADDILDDDLPPAPSPAAMVAFSSRRSNPAGAAPAGAARTPPPVVTPPLTAPTGSAPAMTAPAGSAPKAKGAIPRPVAPARSEAPPPKPKVVPAEVTAQSIPGLGAKPKPRVEGGTITRPVPPGAVTVKPKTIAARPPLGSVEPKARQSRFIFMVMVGLLLLCLALVAAWASFFLTQSTGEAAIEDSTGEFAEAPSIEDEMAADLQEPEDRPVATSAEDDLAALAVEEMPVNIGGDETGPAPTTSVEEAMAAAEPEAAPATAEPGDPAAGTEEMTAGAEDATGEPVPGTTIATNVSSSRTPVEDQDEIFLASMDAPPPILDALALPAPAATADALPAAPMPPPAFGTVYQFDAKGLLVPTPEGILSPDGIMLFAGPPPLVPPARSAAAEAAAAAAQPAAPAETVPDAAAVADASLVTAGETALADPAAEVVETAPADPSLAGFRPKPRPADLVPATDDGASLDTVDASEFADVRPLARPASVTTAALSASGLSVADLGAQGASLAAQGEAKLAAAEALEASNPSIVAISMRPMERPSDLSRAVEDAVAAAAMEPDPNATAEVEVASAPADANPEELAEMTDSGDESVAPAVPTKASVAEEATFTNVLNLKKIALIGTYGTSSDPYALIRQTNGRYKKVEVGDKIDGGVVQSITATEVRYQKGGKLITLKMPKA